MKGVLFLFLDGVGIGPPEPSVNPFLSARLPTLRGLTAGTIPTLDRGPLELSGTAGREVSVRPLDATLGVEGTPQSGTGQTALFTGRNGAERFGRHFGPWVPVALRPLVQEEGLLPRFVRSGGSAAFANAYPEGWPGPKGGKRLAGPPLMAQAAGLLTRHTEALRDGTAVSSEILNDGWRRHLGYDGPDVKPRDAGARLAEIAHRHRLTLYAHYRTDTAGHRGGLPGAREALERVDRFLDGLLEALDPGYLLVVSSDHGNVEDVRVGHTRNPALTLLAGPDAVERGRSLESLTDVTPALLGWLEETA